MVSLWYQQDKKINFQFSMINYECSIFYLHAWNTLWKNYFPHCIYMEKNCFAILVVMGSEVWLWRCTDVAELFSSTYLHSWTCIYHVHTNIFIHVHTCTYKVMKLSTCMYMYINICTMFRHLCTVTVLPYPVQVVRISSPDETIIWNPDHLDRIGQILAYTSEHDTYMFILVHNHINCIDVSESESVLCTYI
jgi:hypothetical protein